PQRGCGRSPASGGQAPPQRRWRCPQFRTLTARTTVGESQRDSVSKPRVASGELPWVNVRQTPPTPTGLWPIPCLRRAGSATTPLALPSIPNTDCSDNRRRIPTGFRLKAQGREWRATLGKRPTNTPYPNGVVADPLPPAGRLRHNA